MCVWVVLGGGVAQYLSVAELGLAWLIPGHGPMKNLSLLLTPLASSQHSLAVYKGPLFNQLSTPCTLEQSSKKKRKHSYVV